MEWIRTETIDPPDDGTVDIWQAAFADWSDRLAALRPHLSETELERAGRFLREGDRDRYIFAHGVLRQILGRCCGCQPGDLRFEVGAHEKPHLSPVIQAGLDWQFNLSHSGDMILVAVTRKAPVGVDVEQCSRKVEVESLSRRFFSGPESEAILALPECDQKRVFMDTWVCKEAFIKAVGEGLSMPLDSFSICFDGELTRVEPTPGRDNPYLDQSWTLVRFLVADGYVGAVAVPMRPFRIGGYRYS